MPEPICLLWTRISEVFDTNEILLMENLSRKYFNFPAFSPLEICEDGGIMIGKCDDSSSLQPLTASGYVCEVQDYNPDLVSRVSVVMDLLSQFTAIVEDEDDYGDKTEIETSDQRVDIS